jgi:ferritin-like metal-binding protein YciE
MPIKNLQDAFVEELRDTLSAEKQITKALRQMAKKASHDELRTAFENHLEQTETHVERLEKAFELLNKKPRASHCEGISGIIEEGKEILQEEAEPDARDVMIIGSAQKVEHYEIAAYGTLCAWADMLGHREIEKLLRETLNEEKQTDEKLNKLAKQVNKEAMAEVSSRTSKD